MNKYFLSRLVLLVSLFVMGTLVLSQGDNDLPAEGLSTQAANTCSGTLCDEVNINRLLVSNSGNVHVTTTGTETSLSCTPLSQAYLSIKDTSTNFKEIYTMLLSAKLNNQAISIKAISENNRCEIQYVYFK